MPLTPGPRTTTPFVHRKTRHALALLFALACAHAPTVSRAQGVNAEGEASPRSQRRVVLGGTSDTARGTRHTVRADGSLSDYSAYRSGDRFVVVLPKSAEGGVARRSAGRGYSGVDVQQRGEDLILSYRMMPGTRARVEQGFNRLDVVFEVPEEGPASGASQREARQGAAPDGQQSASVSANGGATAEQQIPRGAEDPRAGQKAPPTGLPTPDRQPARVGSETAAPAVASSPAPTAGRDDSVEPALVGTGVVVADPGTPAESAQPGPAINGSPAAVNDRPSVSTGSDADAGALLRSYWPVVLVVLLALFGVLILAARRSFLRRDRAGAVEGEAVSVSFVAENEAGAAEQLSSAPPESLSLGAQTTATADDNGSHVRAASEAIVLEPPAVEGITTHHAPAGSVPSEPAAPEAPSDDPHCLANAESFETICAAFDDEDREVRGAAARALYELDPDRDESFTRALREAGPERRRRIGEAINSSGLAAQAISRLTGEDRGQTYEAFSLLFLMARAGEVGPLVRAVEGHPSNEVRLAVVKLLALSGQKEVLTALRRLAVRGGLTGEVRTAVMEAIYQISSQTEPTPTA